MALVLATNAYITVTSANTYFKDSMLFDSWDPVGSTEKSRALITAATQISLILNDANKLPMTTVIDTVVAAANAELALAFILDPSLITKGSTGSNVKKVSATSGTDVEFFRSVKGQRFPANVMNLLQSTGFIGGSQTTKYAQAEAFGLSEPTNVFNPDTFGKPRGFA